MSAPNTDLEHALYGQLAAQAGLTALLGPAATGFASAVYFEEAPQGAAYDLVVFDDYAGPGDLSRSPHRARDVLYLVKGVSATSRTRAAAIDAQLDLALHAQEAAITARLTAGACLWIRRTADVSFTEDGPAGTKYVHRGGVYRVRTDLG